MIFGMTYLQIAEYFLIYSFLGWVLEVAYHGAVVGKIVNRGFLNGPVCPVYGFGMLGILALLHSVNTQNLPLEQTSIPFLFVTGTILCTLVELFAGWLLDQLFHIRWWDYSNQRFNFHGYICLKFSLLWGLAVVLVIRFIHPAFRNFTAAHVLQGWQIGVLLGLYVLYLGDLIVTVMTLVGLNRKIDEVEKARQTMRKLSNGMSAVIGSSAMDAENAAAQAAVRTELARDDLRDKAREGIAQAQENLEAARVNALLVREDQRETFLQARQDAETHMQELKDQYLRTRRSVTSRLLRAFDRARSLRNPEIFEELRQEAEKKEQQK